MIAKISSEVLSFDEDSKRMGTCVFDFLARDPLYEEVKPYYFSGVLEENQEQDRTNLKWNPHQVRLKDLRGLETEVSFEEHGFQLIPHQTSANLIDPSLEDLECYLNEMTSWLKQRLNAEHVLCFNYRARTRKNTLNFTGPHSVGTFKNTDLPQTNPHVDQSKDAAPRRARRHMNDEEIEKYLNPNWRMRLVNIWRPIANMVVDCPLAMCDYHSMAEADLRGCDRASRDYVGEVCFMHYDEAQRWYWFKHQKPEEILMFINYDSNPGSGIPYTPHAAFVDKTTPPNTPPRQSIECAFIVVNSLD